MAYEAGSFEAAIAAAAGNDPALAAELFGAFLESLEYQLDLLSRARCDGNWQLAAKRLHGLGASFHDGKLAELSMQAIDGAPGDPVVIRSIRQYAQSLAASR